MEDINAYIESGILELYVLGQLTPDERLEVEAMAKKHRGVKDELAAIELALEQYARANGIEPSRVLDMDAFTATPGPAEPKIVQLPPARTTNSTLKLALVACLGLLVMSVAALYVISNKLDLAKAQIAQLNLEKRQYASNASFMEQQNKELQLIAAMPDHPEWAKVQLKGVGKSPDAKLLVYWNRKDSKVLINNASRTLPVHDSAHQYQLWALVNGKPVDLGVFDGKNDSTRLVLEMKAITGAQAFAVTLEKAGGSPTPTMEQMVVMGAI